MHGEDEATQEITNQMPNLTYLMLPYLYTLPKQIKTARTRRDGGDA